MTDSYQSLSHSKWDCKYHVVFVPKRRRKVLFGRVRRQLGEMFHGLARQKECQIVEGHLTPDHVHMFIAIPPKYSVASVIGFLKGKSAIAVARLCGKERNFSGEHLWARGYAVSTVGFNIDDIRRYIRDQVRAPPRSLQGLRKLVAPPHRRTKGRVTWCHDAAVVAAALQRRPASQPGLLLQCLIIILDGLDQNCPCRHRKSAAAVSPLTTARQESQIPATKPSLRLSVA
jgi:REP-associated tyrosine transposase